MAAAAKEEVFDQRGTGKTSVPWSRRQPPA